MIDPTDAYVLARRAWAQIDADEPRPQPMPPLPWDILLPLLVLLVALLAWGVS